MSDESERAAERRLWLLQSLLEKMDVEKALALAARMEAFITGVRATSGKDEQRHVASQNAPMHLLDGSIVRRDDHSHSAAKRSPPAAFARNAAGRLLSDAELQAFRDGAVQGASNYDLASRFGLTPRQANAIRMGLAKGTPQVALPVAPRICGWLVDRDS